MVHPVRATRALGVWAVSLGALAAQSDLDRRVDSEPSSTSVRQFALEASGLHRGDDGGLVGVGPAYRATFDPHGVVFTPATPQAPHDYPFAMEVAGFGRGVADRAPSQADPEIDASRVARYPRAEFDETYEVRPEGIKQSFTFHELPDGTGDLVVRLRVTTELNLRAESATRDALEFACADFGGVQLRDVIGIDARGVRTNGSMAFSDDHLELRLPSAFVEAAELPLVLDPLIGALGEIGNASDSNFDPDIAFCVTFNGYLAVWRRVLSGTTHDILGLIFNSDGLPIFDGLFVVQSTGLNARPRCAGMVTENAIVVVYQRSGNIYGRGVGSIWPPQAGPESGIVISAGTEETPDIGGESVADDEAIVVWRDITNNRIEAKQVNVQGGALPVLGPSSIEVAIDATPAGTVDVSPAISKSGGSTGFHCIAWHRNINATGLTQLKARLVNRDLMMQSQVLAVASSGDNDVPDVDGDGRNWVVAWEWEPTPGTGANDVRAASIAYASHLPSGARGFRQSPVVVVAATSADERAPKVAWMGDSAVVMYERGTGSPGINDAVVQPIDLLTCLDCASSFLLPLGASNADQGPARAASQASGGGSTDAALIVWGERDPTNGDGDVFANVFRAEDGISVNLGGGCGNRGFTYAECAMTGNSSFGMRWRDALPGRPTWLVMSPDRLDFFCSGCALVANPLTGFVVARTSDSFGRADVTFSIPATDALVGASLIHQWLVLDTAAPACSGYQLDFSDACRTTIQ